MLLFPVQDLPCDLLRQSVDGAKWYRNQHSFFEVVGACLEARVSSGCWLDMPQDPQKA